MDEIKKIENLGPNISKVTMLRNKNRFFFFFNVFFIFALIEQPSYIVIFCRQRLDWNYTF